jgi:hypothetical protein
VDRRPNYDVQNVTHSLETMPHVEEELLVGFDHIGLYAKTIGNHSWRATAENPSLDLGGNQRIVVKMDLASAVNNLNEGFLSAPRA